MTAPRHPSTAGSGRHPSARAGSGAAAADAAGEREARFASAVLQQVNDAVIAVDLQHCVTYFNAAAERQYGVTAAEALGRPLRDLYDYRWLRPQDEVEAFRAVERGEMWRGENLHVRRDGSILLVESVVSTLRDEAGRAAGLLAVIRDVTGRRQAEVALRESEERLRLATQAGKLGVWDWDLVNHRITWTDSMYAVHGVDRQSFTPSADTYGRLVHPEDRRQIQRAVERTLEGQRDMEIEFRVIRPDGEVVWVFSNATTLREAGRPVRVLGALMDITERKRIELALRESEERFRTLASHAPVGIFLSDRNGSCIYVNDRWCEMAGLTPEQAHGHGWLAAVHPDDRERIASGWDVAVQEAAPSFAEFRFVRPDGTVTWLEGSAVLFRSPEGEVSGYIGTAADITERRSGEARLRESEGKLRLVTDNAPVFLVHLDRDHRFKFVNRAYAQRFGLEPRELVGRHLSEFIGTYEFHDVKHHLDAALAGRRVEFETQAAGHSDEVRWVQIVLSPEQHTRDGIIGYVAAITDITSRRRAELELQRARDEALAASRAKDEFLAALSHELRTPLNPVLLLASDAAENPALPAEVRSVFETIRANVSLEARLIDDLLDLTRITRGKLALDRRVLDVHVVLHEALTIVRPELAEKRLDFRLELTAPRHHAEADPVRLQQVFWNVLKNAVKFTPSGGRIRVRSESSPGDPDRIRLIVSDTGIGMAADDLERVFDAFAQGRHQFGGLGLGLAISRMLVESHGGRIGAESGGLGQGATFWIELPLAPLLAEEVPATFPSQRPALVPSARAESVAAPRRRLLLVEDHPATRAALALLLRQRQFEVFAAAGVHEARELARRNRIDIIISDIGLPDGDGCDLLAELRKRQPALHGIALSGYGMEEDLVRTRAVGYLEHLTKPVNVQTLEQAIARLLARNVGP